MVIAKEIAIADAGKDVEGKDVHEKSIDPATMEIGMKVPQVCGF